MKACIRFVPLAVAVCLLMARLGVSAQSQNKAFFLFGGEGHETFLGCLNCSDISPTSVCNNIGEFGSNIQPDSIWNDIGHFGSDISPNSPWNDIAQDAPIIVDKDGNSYGYFSANDLHHDRTRINWLVAVLDYFEKTKDLGKTREIMCGA
jgi:hypothetical protein